MMKRRIRKERQKHRPAPQDNVVSHMSSQEAREAITDIKSSRKNKVEHPLVTSIDLPEFLQVMGKTREYRHEVDKGLEEGGDFESLICDLGDEGRTIQVGTDDIKYENKETGAGKQVMNIPDVKEETKEYDKDDTNIRTSISDPSNLKEVDDQRKYSCLGENIKFVKEPDLSEVGHLKPAIGAESSFQNESNQSVSNRKLPGGSRDLNDEGNGISNLEHTNSERETTLSGGKRQTDTEPESNKVYIRSRHLPRDQWSIFKLGYYPSFFDPKENRRVYLKKKISAPRKIGKDLKNKASGETETGQTTNTHEEHKGQRTEQTTEGINQETIAPRPVGETAGFDQNACALPVEPDSTYARSPKPEQEIDQTYNNGAADDNDGYNQKERAHLEENNQPDPDLIDQVQRTFSFEDKLIINQQHRSNFVDCTSKAFVPSMGREKLNIRAGKASTKSNELISDYFTKQMSGTSSSEQFPFEITFPGYDARYWEASPSMGNSRESDEESKQLAADLRKTSIMKCRTWLDKWFQV